jgi:serine/threonine-protein kinase
MLPPTIGKYEVAHRLGEGAMGEVFLARDPFIGRSVAVKLMKTDSAGDRERFLQEARTVGALSHPNIVVLHDFGFHDGRPFLVMEFVPGRNLEDWLREPHTLDEHLKIVEGLCRALLYAHERGVLHRDLKPSNVQVLPEGDCKLMDFGIARTGTGRLTTAHTVLGTPSFIAPEILEEAAYSASADVYSAGVLVYEMLAGVNPFAGKTVASTLHNVLNR